MIAAPIPLTASTGAPAGHTPDIARLHLAIAKLEELPGPIRDPTGDGRAPRQQSQDGAAGEAFARSALPHKAERLTGGDFERHAPHDGPSIAGERDGQAVDLKGLSRAHGPDARCRTRCRRRGSRRSW